MRYRVLLTTSCLVLMTTMPALVAAQHDWNGSEQQIRWASGDQSLHGAWKVYRHDRGDATYIHVEDTSGTEQLIIGSSGGVSVASSGAVPVSTPDSPLPVPEGAVAHLVYVDDDVSLTAFTTESAFMWSIESSPAQVY